MREVYRLSLRQLTGPVRMGLILLLGALPVALAAVLVWTSGDNGIERDGFVNVLISALMVAGILPVVAMTLATASFGNELEDGTLANLALMPLTRWRIVLAKLAAVFTICGPVIIASGLATYIIGFGLEAGALLSLAVGAAPGSGGVLVRLHLDGAGHRQGAGRRPAVCHHLGGDNRLPDQWCRLPQHPGLHPGRHARA